MERGETITYREMGPDDLDLLLGVAPGLFDHPVRPEEARAFLEDPGHVLILAHAGGLAVGIASGTVLLHPDKAPAFFVNEVGTREGWRRRGIGRGVTEAIFAVARARGCRGIWLGADLDNAPAQALYRALGGDEVMIVGFGWDGAFDA